MMKYVKEVHVPAPLEEVFAYCTSLEGFRRQFPFAVKWLAGPDNWQRGDVLDFRYRVSGVWVRHCAEVVDFKRNEYFADCMTHGLYSHFRHTHRFRPGNGGTHVQDEIEFSLGFGGLVDKLIGMPTLHSTFKKRHAALLKHFARGERT